ncbi:hypothetical protein GGR56DRAFT_628912 [Xylariaceae sp. FL0804]|nr:hypothetical protein GGR56DRAFT_628912 [Xylariaceae sp. FL0804]
MERTSRATSTLPRLLTTTFVHMSFTPSITAIDMLASDVQSQLNPENTTAHTYTLEFTASHLLTHRYSVSAVFPSLEVLYDIYRFRGNQGAYLQPDSFSIRIIEGLDGPD